MCGIAGYVSKKKPTKEIVKMMTDRIAHRGPDAEGFFTDEKCALGHRRLSIIDIEKGVQPMFNENSDIVIVFNGEIYNFIELRKELETEKHVFKTDSDTEVLVHGYEQWGTKLASKLRGMFAFAIWDTQKEELYMARDCWGIKPCYYYENDGTFMFASEIKAFLDHPDFKKELNEKILSAYLCFNSTPTEETFFKGVYRLEPGHQLIYRDGQKKIERFFKFEFEHSNEDMEKTVEKIEKAMKDSVEHHKIADVEVGAFLSGGVDSSYIVSLARPDKTYTVGYDNSKYDEAQYSRKLAEELGINNTSRKVSKKEYMEKFSDIIYYMDEPLADPSAIALYFVAERAAKDVKVVMSGEGADEFFGGYNSYKEEISQQWYMKIPYCIRHMAAVIAGLLPDIRGGNFIYRRGQKLENYNIGLGRVFRDKEAMKLVKCKNQIHTKDIVASLYKEHEGNTDLEKRQIIDFYFWLVKDFLHAVDRDTMMCGLEARTPFLDKEVYEVARKLPVNAKINEKTTKVALRKAAQKVIPDESYNRKKLGFPVPLREWVKDEDVYLEIKEKFTSKEANKFFEQNRIMKLLDEHKNGKKDCYKKIWAIYTFLVWYERYFA